MLFVDEATGKRFKLPWLPDARPIENGGYLIGRIIKGTHDRVVDCFTEVHPGDEATEVTLFLTDPYHQWKINREWELNGGSVIGHWHTHDEMYPKPSSVDLEGWKKTANSVYESSGASPLMCVIQGRAQTRAWIVFPDAMNTDMRELSDESHV